MRDWTDLPRMEKGTCKNWLKNRGFWVDRHAVVKKSKCNRNQWLRYWIHKWNRNECFSVGAVACQKLPLHGLPSGKPINQAISLFRRRLQLAHLAKRQYSTQVFATPHCIFPRQPFFAWLQWKKSTKTLLFHFWSIIYRIDLLTRDQPLAGFMSAPTWCLSPFAPGAFGQSLKRNAFTQHK